MVKKGVNKSFGGFVSNKIFIILLTLVFLLSISFFFDSFALKLSDKIELSLFENFEFFFDYLFFIILFLGLSIIYIKSKDLKTVVLIWLSGGIAFFVSFILKLIFSRPRILGEKFYPLVDIANYSFPSSHTIVVFSIVPLLFIKNNKYRFIWLFYSIMVGSSRILLKQHYLSDVVGGIFFATLLGYLLYIFIDRYFDNKALLKFLRM